MSDGVMGDRMREIPEVCVMHGRFRPCRRRFLCRYSSDPAAVAAVRDYQDGTVSTWEATTWK